MGVRLRLRSALVLGAACMAFSTASSAGTDAHRRAGDTLRYAMPAGVAVYELWQGDREGLWQFGKAWGATLVATEVLKRSTHVERPDHTNDMSFPSGHASDAFAAATFMHRRHGIEQAWPWYAAATYVGWTRVQADRHRWGDILGSAAVAGAASWWLATPANDRKLSVLPTIAPGLIAVQLHASW